MIPREKIEAGILARVRKHPRKGYMKFRYPRGPWDTEPDFCDWTTAAGLPGGVMRHRELGTFAGYVQIPVGHPWHGSHYDGAGAHVHGGVNFSAADADGSWWIGFDCAHFRDLVPLAMVFPRRMPPRFREAMRGLFVYRDFAYVRNEVEDLARQVVEAAH